MVFCMGGVVILNNKLCMLIHVFKRRCRGWAHSRPEYVEKQLSANEYIFSARLEIDYLNEKYNLNLPVDDAETLSGYIIENHESIPQPKERIIIGNYEYLILSVSSTRIETVKVKALNNQK